MDSLFPYLGWHLPPNAFTQTFDFGLKGLRHVIHFDLSFNEITEIPENVIHLQYLSEFNLSHNKIEIIPKDICELLSLPDKGLKISFNPVTNIPKEVLEKGMFFFSSYDPACDVPWVLLCSRSNIISSERRRNVTLGVRITWRWGELIFGVGSLEAIRTHFDWERPAVRETGPPKNVPTMSKSLSTREKRGSY